MSQKCPLNILTLLCVCPVMVCVPICVFASNQINLRIQLLVALGQLPGNIHTSPRRCYCRTALVSVVCEVETGGFIYVCVVLSLTPCSRDHWVMGVIDLSMIDQICTLSGKSKALDRNAVQQYQAKGVGACFYILVGSKCPHNDRNTWQF